MAHTCPDCGQTCYCNGDVDDIDFGDGSPEAAICVHCFEGADPEPTDCDGCSRPEHESGCCDNCEWRR